MASSTRESFSVKNADLNAAQFSQIFLQNAAVVVEALTEKGIEHIKESLIYEGYCKRELTRFKQEQEELLRPKQEYKVLISKKRKGEKKTIKNPKRKKTKHGEIDERANLVGVDIAPCQPASTISHVAHTPSLHFVASPGLTGRRAAEPLATAPPPAFTASRPRSFAIIQPHPADAEELVIPDLLPPPAAQNRLPLAADIKIEPDLVPEKQAPRSVPLVVIPAGNLNGMLLSTSTSISPISSSMRVAVAPVAPVVSVAPVAPVAPAAPAATFAPVAPVAPATTFAPVAPVALVATDAPVAPILPVATVTPVAPIAPVAPVAPAAPAATFAPVAPVVSVAPVAPVAPAATDAPVAPIFPVATVTPVAPIAPVVSVASNAPATPVASVAVRRAPLIRVRDAASLGIRAEGKTRPPEERRIPTADAISPGEESQQVGVVPAPAERSRGDLLGTGHEVLAAVAVHAATVAHELYKLSLDFNRLKKAGAVTTEMQAWFQQICVRLDEFMAKNRATFLRYIRVLNAHLTYPVVMDLLEARVREYCLFKTGDENVLRPSQFVHIYNLIASGKWSHLGLYLVTTERLSTAEVRPSPAFPTSAPVGDLPVAVIDRLRTNTGHVMASNRYDGNNATGNVSHGNTFVTNGSLVNNANSNAPSRPESIFNNSYGNASSVDIPQRNAYHGSSEIISRLNGPPRISYPPHHPIPHSNRPSATSFPPNTPVEHNNVPSANPYPPNNPVTHNRRPSANSYPSNNPFAHNNVPSANSYPPNTPVEHNNVPSANSYPPNNTVTHNSRPSANSYPSNTPVVPNNRPTGTAYPLNTPAVPNNRPTGTAYPSNTPVVPNNRPAGTWYPPNTPVARKNGYSRTPYTPNITVVPNNRPTGTAYLPNAPDAHNNVPSQIWFSPNTQISHSGGPLQTPHPPFAQDNRPPQNGHPRHTPFASTSHNNVAPGNPCFPNTTCSRTTHEDPVALIYIPNTIINDGRSNDSLASLANTPVGSTHLSSGNTTVGTTSHSYRTASSAADSNASFATTYLPNPHYGSVQRRSSVGNVSNGSPTVPSPSLGDSCRVSGSSGNASLPVPSHTNDSFDNTHRRNDSRPSPYLTSNNHESIDRCSPLTLFDLLQDCPSANASLIMTDLGNETICSLPNPAFVNPPATNGSSPTPVHGSETLPNAALDRRAASNEQLTNNSLTGNAPLAKQTTPVQACGNANVTTKQPANQRPVLKQSQEMNLEKAPTPQVRALDAGAKKKAFIDGKSAALEQRMEELRKLDSPHGAAAQVVIGRQGTGIVALPTKRTRTYYPKVVKSISAAWMRPGRGGSEEENEVAIVGCVEKEASHSSDILKRTTTELKTIKEAVVSNDRVRETVIRETNDNEVVVLPEVVDHGPCVQCGGESVGLCGACQGMAYCSDDCMTNHWNNRHSVECPRIFQ